MANFLLPLLDWFFRKAKDSEDYKIFSIKFDLSVLFIFFRVPFHFSWRKLHWLFERSWLRLLLQLSWLWENYWRIDSVELFLSRLETISNVDAHPSSTLLFIVTYCVDGVRARPSQRRNHMNCIAHLLIERRELALILDSISNYLHSPGWLKTREAIILENRSQDRSEGISVNYLFHFHFCVCLFRPLSLGVLYSIFLDWSFPYFKNVGKEVHPKI